MTWFEKIGQIVLLTLAAVSTTYFMAGQKIAPYLATMFFIIISEIGLSTAYIVRKIGERN